MEISKKKLKEESRLRRQAEIAQVEMEARHQDAGTNFFSLREENDSLRGECEALHEELAFKCREVEELKKGQEAARQKMATELGNRLESTMQRREERSRGEGSLSAMDSNIDDSYGEVLDELETVTEQLISTQQKLWKTEDSLRESEARVQVLDNRFNKVEKDSLLDVSRGVAESTTGENTVDSEFDKRLLDELSLMKEELAMAHKELRAAEEQTERYQSKLNDLGRDDVNISGIASQKSRIQELKHQVRELEDSARMAEDHLQEYEQFLKETKEENVELIEEVACLRHTLRDQIYPDDAETDEREEIAREVRSTVLKEANREREREINLLREKFKKIFKENASLQQRIDELESGTPRPLGQMKQVSKLKEEISRLNLVLKTAQGQSRSDILETESSFDTALLSLQEEMDSILKEREKLQDKISGLEEALAIAQQRNEKSMQQKKLSDSNLEASRNEILTLKSKLVRSEDELEYYHNRASKLESDLEMLQGLYADTKAELEVSNQIIEEAGLEEESINRVDTTKLKQQINALSLSLEKVKRDYSDLIAESKDSRQRLCESLAGDSKKSEDEIVFLANRVAGLEEQLEESKLKESHLLKRLRGRKIPLTDEKGSLENFSESSNTTAAEMKLELEDAKATIAPLQTELSECQAALALSLIESTKLKEDLKKALKSNNANDRGMDSLYNFFNENHVVIRDAPDPDPISTGDEGVEVSANDELYTRDPPTSRSLMLGSAVDDERNVGILRARLLDITLENETLKAQVIDASAGEESKQEEVLTLRLRLENAEQKIGRLETLEKTLEDSKSQLFKKEAHLESSKASLADTREENQALRAEIAGLKKVVKDTRRNLDDAKKELPNDYPMKDSGEFEGVKRQLKQLTEEKAAIQHQLDDTKISMSVSQYAQERNKEELRVAEGKLENAVEDIYRLKNEISKMDRDMSDLNSDYNKVLRELDSVHERSHFESNSKQEVETLTKHLKQLADDNVGLQQMATELEEALSISQQEVDQKCAEIKSLENNLVSTQEETQLLSEEISHLSTAFETAKGEYDAVVDELEAVNELFEEARQEAERSGRETAAEEIRAEMHAARDTERKVMKEQLKKVFEENAALQRKADEAETLLYNSRALNNQGEELGMREKEISMLKEALNSSSEEVKNLKEKEFNLNLAFRETKRELKNSQNELELVVRSFDDARHEAEKKARATAVEEFRSGTESKEQQALRDHLKKMIDDNAGLNMQSESCDLDSGHKAVGLRLKIELLDMSMSLEKVMKENAVMEEELERLKSTMNETREEAEKRGRLKATKEVRDEMKLEREKEMRDFKEQFNTIVQENTTLGRNFRDAEIALKLAKDSQDRSKNELNRLETELRASKLETRKFQEEVFNLTMELETANEDHERVMEDIRSSIRTDRDAKVASLKHQLSALSIENATLQHKLRSAGMALANTQNSEGRSKVELDYLYESLQTSQEAVIKLEEEVASLKNELEYTKIDSEKLLRDRKLLETKLTEAEAALIIAKSSKELNSKLGSTNNETSELRSKVYELSKSLEESTKELGELQARFNKACNDAEHRGRAAANLQQNSEALVLKNQLEKLLKEKADLQLQADDTRIALTLTKHSQERKEEALTIFQEQLLSSKKQAEEMGRLAEEAGLDQEDKEVEMKALREQIKAFVTEMSLLERQAEDAQAELYVSQESKEKHKMDLKLCELKYEESRKEAASLKAEVLRLQSTLEFAQVDHSSLREQLEHMNVRVAHLCKEAEERGKAAASQELKAGIKSLKGHEQEELMFQLKRFYEENVALQNKLEKLEAELAVARSASHEKLAKADKLESANKRLHSELEDMKRDLKESKRKRDVVVKELEIVKQRLAEVREEGPIKDSTTNSDAITVTSEAEVRLLQDQFKKLSKKSATLGLKVEAAEIAVATMQTSQGRKRCDNELLVEATKDTQERIDQAIDESKKRDEDIGELAVMMESNVSMTEAKMKNLEQEISVAKGGLQVSEAGLLVMRRQRAKRHLSRRAKQAVVATETTKETEPQDQPAVSTESLAESSEEGSSGLASSGLASSESRDDTSASLLQALKKRPSSSSTALAQESKNIKEGAVSSLALETIANGKKKAWQFDLKHAQSKIFGADKKVAARTSPFAKRILAKYMPNSPESNIGGDINRAVSETVTHAPKPE